MTKFEEYLLDNIQFDIEDTSTFSPKLRGHFNIEGLENFSVQTTFSRETIQDFHAHTGIDKSFFENIIRNELLESFRKFIKSPEGIRYTRKQKMRKLR